jgi:nitrogen fixation protein FixH
MNPNAKSRRNPWPIAIIAYFILFISFTTLTVVYLSRQKMDLVRGDYYDDEIRYQEQLDRMNRTQPFNAQVAIAYDSARQSITIALPSAHAQFLTSGRIRLYRPSDESLDQDIKLTVSSDGVQRVSAKNLAPGLWKVRVYWTVKGQDYFFGQTVIIGHTQS